MTKKVFTLALGLTLALGAAAQYENPVVPQDSIRFWTGSGSNRAVIAVTWNDATAGNIGIAWGVQWNGTNVTIGNLMDTIATYDSRVTLSGNTASFISNIAYNDSELGLNLVGPENWWWYNWKAADGSSHSSSSVSADIAVNGDFVDWLPMDESTYASYPADTMIYATNPNAAPAPEEATIAASDILYWVGTGSNQAILAVNWADTALAWGYRWNGTATVQNMMDDISAADARFSYIVEGGYLSDIRFVKATNDTLAVTPGNWFESKNNGVTDAGLYQTLADGDFEKWADPAAGVVVDSSSYEYDGVTYWYYIYVYPMTIHPVSTYVGIEGPANSTPSINVYPNPVADVLNVTLDVKVATEAALYDMSGRQILAATVAAGTRAMQIPVAHIAAGTYLLRVGNSTVKVTKN